jgi:hypothetical protein
MTDEPENHTLALLREIRGDIAKVREEMREGFERVDERIAEVKSEVIKCRKDVADADWVAKGVAVRLTNLEKRVKALEEARPEA